MSGRTVTTLETVMLDECRLHRMKVAGGSQSFDRGDFIILMHHRQRQAGVDATPSYDHRTSAALAMITAFFCPSQV